MPTADFGIGQHNRGGEFGIHLADVMPPIHRSCPDLDDVDERENAASWRLSITVRLKVEEMLRARRGQYRPLWFTPGAKGMGGR